MTMNEPLQDIINQLSADDGAELLDYVNGLRDAARNYLRLPITDHRDTLAALVGEPVTERVEGAFLAARGILTSRDILPAIPIEPDYRALIPLIADSAHHYIQHDSHVDCLMIDFGHNRPHIVHFLPDEDHLALLLDEETGGVLGFYIENISFAHP